MFAQTFNTYKWSLPVLLLLVIFYALGIIGGDEKIKPGVQLAAGHVAPKDAKLLTLGSQLSANVQSWQGSVQSRSVARLAPKLNARILEIVVHPGDAIKKNEVLARLDDRDSRAAYEAASSALLAVQAQAAQANAEEKRMTDLYEKQAATRQNYEVALAQAQSQRALVHQAASKLQQSKLMLGENVLTAPFDGVVGERLQEPGDMGLQNQPILVVLKPEDLRLEVAVAGQCASKVRLGMKLKVRVDAIDRALEATVDEIAPEIDAQTRNQLIKLSLPKAQGLRHGQFGWLELGCQAEQPALLIPASAVLNYGQLQAVKVVKGQQWTVRHIRTGKQQGDRLEVLSGLKAGETILLEPSLSSVSSVRALERGDDSQ